MKCHALGCHEPALTGLPPCYDHWLLWPPKVRARTPWVTRPAPVDSSANLHEKAVDETRNLHRQERGQMALFA